MSRGETSGSLTGHMLEISGEDNTENFRNNFTHHKDHKASKDKAMVGSDSENDSRPARSRSVESNWSRRLPRVPAAETNQSDDDVRKSRKKREKKERRKKKKGALESLEHFVSSDSGKNRYQRILDEDSDSCEEEMRKTHTKDRPRGHAPVEDEVKQLNVVPISNDQVLERVASVEERLRRLEENTQMSLYNIEALLRNFIFYQSSAQPGAAGSRGRNTGASSYTSEYGQGFYNDRF